MKDIDTLPYNWDVAVAMEVLLTGVERISHGHYKTWRAWEAEFRVRYSTEAWYLWKDLNIDGGIRQNSVLHLLTDLQDWACFELCADYFGWGDHEPATTTSAGGDPKNGDPAGTALPGD